MARVAEERAAEVVVVGADDDRLVGRRSRTRQHADHVLHLVFAAANVDLPGDAPALQFGAVRRGSNVDLPLQLGQIDAERGADHAIHRRPMNVQHGNVVRHVANRPRPVMQQRIVPSLAVANVEQVVADDDHRRAMIVGRGNFPPQIGIIRILDAVEDAFRVRLLRLVPEQHHGLAGHFDAGIVVVSFRLRRNSVTDKDQRQVEMPRTAVHGRREIAIQGQGQPQRRLARPIRRTDQRQAVVRPDGDFRGHAERLKGRAAEQVGPQADLAELLRHIVRRQIEPRGPQAAAFQLVGRQVAVHLGQALLDGLVVGGGSFFRPGAGGPKQERRRCKRAIRRGAACRKAVLEMSSRGSWACGGSGAGNSAVCEAIEGGVRGPVPHDPTPPCYRFCTARCICQSGEIEIPLQPFTPIAPISAMRTASWPFRPEKSGEFSGLPAQGPPGRLRDPRASPAGIKDDLQAVRFPPAGPGVARHSHPPSMGATRTSSGEMEIGPDGPKVRDMMAAAAILASLALATRISPSLAAPAPETSATLPSSRTRIITEIQSIRGAGDCEEKT